MGNSINISKYLGRKLAGITAPTSSIDPDAEAFITAANITDTTQQTAIIQLVTDLKNYNLWTKAPAIYPFVGGTASSHKFNLKDPRDLNAAYRLVFYGGVTHNANGVTFNLTNAYADTFYNESLIETFANTHRAVYDRSTNIDNACQLGSQGAGSGSQRNLIYTNYGNLLIVDCYNTSDTNGRLVLSNGGSNAFWVNSRIAVNNMRPYKNGVAIGLAIGASIGTQPNVNTYIGAYNSNGTPAGYTNHNLAFVSLGFGLTGTEVANYYTAVQAFQTTLGRQV